MSLEAVREFLARNAPDIQIVELPMSSSTVALSAAWNILPAQIAKSLVLKVGDLNLLLVTCGNSRLDNRKIKAELGGKARMLSAEDSTSLTGHPAGGVCPFALSTPLPVYFDVQLKKFGEVVPGAGSTHAALRIAPERMARLVGAQWVNVCEDRQ